MFGIGPVNRLRVKAVDSCSRINSSASFFSAPAAAGTGDGKSEGNRIFRKRKTNLLIGGKIISGLQAQMSEGREEDDTNEGVRSGEMFAVMSFTASSGFAMRWSALRRSGACFRAADEPPRRPT